MIEMDESNRSVTVAMLLEGNGFMAVLKGEQINVFLYPWKTARNESFFQAFFRLLLKRIEDLSL